MTAKSQHRAETTNNCRQTLPLRLPRLLLKSVVYGLSYRRLHEVDVADDLRRERVTKVTVKLTSIQTLCTNTITSST